MRWFRRKSKGVKEEEPVGISEARAALEKSQQDVQRVENLIKEVRPVMGALHRRREQNGFTALFEQALKGERGGT